MRRGKTSAVALTQEERGLIFGAAVAQVAFMVMPASMNYLVPAMAADFDASSAQTEVLRQVSSVASLAVVFLAGVLGERLGERRVMLASSAIFMLGSAVVAISPGIYAATLGVFLASLGKSVISVVIIALIAVRIRDHDARATGFATLSSVVPLAYLVMPLVAGALASGPGWRWIAVIWLLCGAIAAVAIIRLLPGGGATVTSGEMWTPALAGLALASMIQFIGNHRDYGWTTATITYLILAAGGVIGTAVAYRLVSEPTLSLAPLKAAGIPLLLITLLIFSFTNLFYYTTVLYQVSYGYSSFEAALLMVPTQVCSTLGAIIAGRMLQSRGATSTGGLMMGLLVLILAGAAVVPPGAPMIVPMVAVSMYALCSVAAFVAFTTAIMNSAPQGQEGQMSSYRTAAGQFGTALGVSVMTAAVTFAATQSWSQLATEAGVDSTTASQAAFALLDGVSPPDVSSTYSIPIAETLSIGAFDAYAYAQGYRAQAAVSAVVILVALLLFSVTQRRLARRKPAAAEAG